LGRDRLLDLEHQRGSPRAIDGLERRARRLVFLVADPAARARAALHHDLVPGLRERARSRGRERDALLARLDLLRHPDDHRDLGFGIESPPSTRCPLASDRDVAIHARSRSSGQVLITRSGPIQARRAMATPRSALARSSAACVSVLMATSAPSSTARRAGTSPRSSRPGEALISTALPRRAAVWKTRSRSTAEASRWPSRRPVGWARMFTE